MSVKRTETKVSLPLEKARWQPSLLAGQIVLVSSRSSRGDPHVARKSWISMAASDPPMLGLGCRLSHRTAINILETREFVVNIPDEKLVTRLWEAGDSVGADEQTVTAPAWGLVPAERVGAPRIQECRGHIECVLDATRRLSDEELFLFARIVAVSMDEALARGPAAERYRRLGMIFYLEEDLFGVIESARKLDR